MDTRSCGVRARSSESLTDATLWPQPDERVELFMPERMADELSVELPGRIRAIVCRNALSDELGEEFANIVVLEEAVCAVFEDEARARSLRDPNDWPGAAPTRRHRPRYFGPIASGSG